MMTELAKECSGYNRQLMLIKNLERIGNTPALRAERSIDVNRFNALVHAMYVEQVRLLQQAYMKMQGGNNGAE